MKRLVSINGNIVLVRKFLFSLMILLVLINTVNLVNFKTVTHVTAATKDETFDLIVSAFEKIEQATLEGIDVQSYIDNLNIALEKYRVGLYNQAYTIAETIRDEVTEIINNARWGKIFPYVIIPINIIVIAAIIVFFGRNILGWFKRKRDEEYLDLEIVYEIDVLNEGNDKKAAK